MVILWNGWWWPLGAQVFSLVFWHFERLITLCWPHFLENAASSSLISKCCKNSYMAGCASLNTPVAVMLCPLRRCWTGASRGAIVRTSSCSLKCQGKTSGQCLMHNFVYTLRNNASLVARSRHELSLVLQRTSFAAHATCAFWWDHMKAARMRGYRQSCCHGHSAPYPSITASRHQPLCSTCAAALPVAAWPKSAPASPFLSMISHNLPHAGIWAIRRTTWTATRLVKHAEPQPHR